MKILWLFAITIVVIVIILLMERLRRNSIYELNKILYVNQNYQLYLSLLDNKRLKWLFKPDSISLLRLDAYLLLDDKMNTEHCMENICYRKLSKGEQYEYNQKALSYYCQKCDQIQAQNILKNIQQWHKRHQTNKSYLEEATIIYRLYIENDINIEASLMEATNDLDINNRAIANFRLAKLYQANAIDKDINILLNKALNQFKDHRWKNICRLCLDDYNNLKQF